MVVTQIFVFPQKLWFTQSLFLYIYIKLLIAHESLYLCRNYDGYHKTWLSVIYVCACVRALVTGYNYECYDVICHYDLERKAKEALCDKYMGFLVHTSDSQNILFSLKTAESRHYLYTAWFSWKSRSFSWFCLVILFMQLQILLNWVSEWIKPTKKQNKNWTKALD